MIRSVVEVFVEQLELVVTFISTDHVRGKVIFSQLFVIPLREGVFLSSSQTMNCDSPPPPQKK